MRGSFEFYCSSVVVNPSSTIDIGSEEVEFPVCLAIVAEHVRLIEYNELDSPSEGWKSFVSHFGI